jgi:cystathionine gamma-synthase
VVVDNTFATPLLQRPLELGADVVVHSATKLIGGHSDLLLGAAVTTSPVDLQQLRTARSLNGATPGMLECFLALRGSRTLAVRLRQAQASAGQLAKRLAGHPAVSRVRYPGFGTIVSFELADADAADRACRATRIIRHATSLGGVETCMERAPGPGAHPPGADPAQHRLRRSGRRVARPRRRAVFGIHSWRLLARAQAGQRRCGCLNQQDEAID